MNSSPEPSESSGHHQPTGGEICRTHLVSYFVQIGLELIFHVFGQVGAAGSNLVHVLLLPLTGEVKGHLMGEQVVDLCQEVSGHCIDPVQRMSKVLLALPGHTNTYAKKTKDVRDFQICRQTDRADGRTEGPLVGDELLLQHCVVPAEHDGLLVVLVPVLDGRVSVALHVLNGGGEVGLDEADHGFLLFAEALQGGHLTCTGGENRSAVSAWKTPETRRVSLLMSERLCLGCVRTVGRHQNGGGDGSESRPHHQEANLLLAGLL